MPRTLNFWANRNYCSSQKKGIHYQDCQILQNNIMSINDSHIQKEYLYKNTQYICRCQAHERIRSKGITSMCLSSEATMFKLFAVLLPVLFLSFAMAWAQPGNVTGLSFQIVALSRAPDEHANNLSSFATDDMRLPILTSARFVYGVFVSIGTGQGFKLQVLGLDTSTSMSWVMCEPCQPSLPQAGHLFSPAASPTFHGVHSNDPVCTAPYRPTANGCSFRFPFASGYLSRDTFHLRNGGLSGGAPIESVPGIMFGCAHSVAGFHNDGTLGGVLSLSHLRLSLLTQLSARAGGRFSYCLPKPTQGNPHGFLRLGADVLPPLPHSHMTALTVRSGSAPDYYLSLVGITLAEKRLRIDPRVFAAGRGGCSINPAATITAIMEPAYLVVERALVAYMKELGSDRVKKGPPGGGALFFDRMYKSVQARLPSMAFHFKDGAELWFTPEQLFEVHGMVAWFMMVGKGYRRTVIGAPQQVNTRFTFDVAAGRLSFASELCG
ncbi:aspartyl protease 25-like [Brachypodium distachyon]|uniref:aspartyl protease 25-like n=1 Tax=Brachypodium distachyon TaxID=15368 RepID=UPI000D0C9DFF|nr:aspartyl protease 25-like [Brachypodium distachyon]|eukprot:XP_003559132.2 aspartyl protease 25-like [Brachypodium distachyon]